MTNTNIIKTVVGLFVAMAFGMAGCGGGGDTPTTTVPAGTNSVPVANAGAAQNVIIGAVVTLDASTSSDTDGDPLSYTWSFTSKPAGSNATLSSTTDAKTTFIADVAGAYVFNLVVNDGKVNSSLSSVTITASVANADQAVPLSPTGLTASTVSSSQINLTWTDNSNNETSFKIERKMGLGGTYALIGSITANAVSYSDTGLTASTNYYYRVYANNSYGTSEFYSNESSSTTLAASQACYQSSIISPVPFMGNNEEIFKLADNTYWEVKYEYEYLYAYYPNVIICPSMGELQVNGKTLTVAQLTSAYESKIDGTFNGWDGSTIVSLINGQIWQQSEYYYYYRYAYRPDVLIYKVGAVYKMKIDGIDRSVSVTRLQ